MTDVYLFVYLFIYLFIPMYIYLFVRNALPMIPLSQVNVSLYIYILSVPIETFL